MFLCSFQKSVELVPWPMGKLGTYVKMILVQYLDLTKNLTSHYLIPLIVVIISFTIEVNLTDRNKGRKSQIIK